MKFQAIDYIYSVSLCIVGILLIASPRTFMGRGAGYTEESIKTEKLVKIVGGVLIAASVVLAGFIFFREDA